MKILGIRNSPKEVRYAVLEWNGSKAIFINAAKENRLLLPSDYDNISDKIFWLFQEVDRIVRQEEIGRIAIKTSEYGQEKKTTRETSYLDASVLLQARINGVQCCTRIYKSISNGLSRKKIMGYSESKFGKTDKYWNVQIADAVAVAWSFRS